VLRRKDDVEVRISRHTLSVGGQIYPLRNLARIQCWKRVPDKTKIAYRVLRPALVVLFALVGINILVSVADGVAPPWLRTLNVLAGLATAGITGLRFAIGVLRRPEYLMLLETTGYPIGVLSSPRRETIEDLVQKVAGAIESPPTSPIVTYLSNVVVGDQINQSGDSPIGKVVYGA
jgi:hypothetical protein